MFPEDVFTIATLITVLSTAAESKLAVFFCTVKMVLPVAIPS